jgi:hypothetical protein
VNRPTRKKSSLLDYLVVENQIEILWISHLNKVDSHSKDVLNQACRQVSRQQPLG